MLHYGQQGKNLFNKDTVKSGYSLNSLGVEVVNASYSISDYIEVESNTNYFINYQFMYTAFYDENKVYISTISGVTNTSITTPLNAKFLKFTIYSSYLATTQMEEGTVATIYETYRYQIDKDLVEDKLFDINIIPNNGIPYNKTDFMSVGKNLFNKDAVTDGYYVNQTNGTLDASASYSSSDFIKN